jgi:hypothetical protein
MNEIITKKCTKCGEILPIDYFGNDNRTRSGKKSACRHCYALLEKVYYKNNSEQCKLYFLEYNKTHTIQKQNYNKKYWNDNCNLLKEKNSKYRHQHKEEITKQHSEYYSKNKDRMRERDKKYCDLNRDKVRNRSKKYYYENKDYVLRHSREYRIAHIDVAREREKKYRTKNPEAKRYANRNRHLRIKKAIGNGVSFLQWKHIVYLYGGRCLYPGCKETKLTMDHIVPLSLGGAHDVYNVQPLCGSHNSRKHTKIIDYRCFEDWT